MSDFSKHDVLRVAEALLDDAVGWDDGDLGCRNPRDGYGCQHCSASYYQKREELAHDLDCVVLVAQDLMTRSKGSDE
jgi:hypothetical protein